MQPVRKSYYTPVEYLALEEKADQKSEYFKGEIFLMAGGSVKHNLITLNIAGALNQGLLDRNCRTFMSDMRLLVRENGLYTYPDVMVVCGPVELAEDRQDTITNPGVIIEVLSASTRIYDRNGKFQLYRELASLRDYVLIDQDRMLVEYYHYLDKNKWMLETFEDSRQMLKLLSIDFELPLARIYSKIDF